VIDLDRGERRLSDRGLRPSSWSPDGNYLLANDLQEMWLVSVEGEAEMVRVGSRNGFARRGEFSPDGSYIAFVSDESGRDEVYVVPTPPAEGRQEPVSIDGGSEPRWRADGQELFFLSPSRSVMSVEVDIGERFSAGIPRELFTVSDALSGSGYDVSGDGQRFLFPTLPGSEGEDAPITVVLNWWVGLEP
jgi:dipeptidyl aminopeptidase/acylaminoacyl peptidase